MVNIREMRPDEMLMLKSWWAGHQLPEPTEAMFPLRTTFVLETEGEPVLSAAIVETNMPYMCLVENYVSKPNVKVSEELGELLLTFLRIRAKMLGYQNLVCLSTEPQLTKRYQEMGFKSMAKGIEFLQMQTG